MRDQKGPNNPNWKGGQTKSKKGYVYVKREDHPRAMKSGYVKRTDLVMEALLGRPLEKGEEVHHKNKIRDDDSPDNLELHSKQSHALLHAAETKKPKPSKIPQKRIIWPPMEELEERLKTMSLRQLAPELGCSHVSLFLRMKGGPAEYRKAKARKER